MNALLQPSDLKQALERHGVAGGLKFMNDRVPHRLTAIYQLRGPNVICTHLFDKQGELNTDLMAVVPLGESFCQFAMRDGVFLTDNTVVDTRLDGNPNQGVVVCYHGLPVLDANATLFGTLCHFDFVPRELPDGEFEYLQQAARLIAGYLR
jgi:GAF domain-containing protein